MHWTIDCYVHWHTHTYSIQVWISIDFNLNILLTTERKKGFIVWKFLVSCMWLYIFPFTIIQYMYFNLGCEEVFDLIKFYAFLTMLCKWNLLWSYGIHVLIEIELVRKKREKIQLGGLIRYSSKRKTVLQKDHPIFWHICNFLQADMSIMPNRSHEHTLTHLKPHKHPKICQHSAATKYCNAECSAFLTMTCWAQISYPLFLQLGIEN